MGRFTILERRRPVASLIAGAALVPLIGALDYLTGYDLSFTAFYLVPVFLLAWAGGRGVGIIGAIASAAVWTIVDVFDGRPYSNRLLLYGTAVLQAVLFTAAAVVVSALKRHVEQHKVLAGTDRLTGALGPRTFRDTLQREIDRAHRYHRPCTLAYFDIDNLKSINDTHGHAEGDSVLRTVATAIATHSRSTDTVGRLGGDEFGLLLPETDPDQARIAVEKLRQGILADLSTRGWAVTVSVGAYTVTDKDTAVDPVIRQADRLMYAAKARNAHAAPQLRSSAR